jgi:PqqD family protein of HPr-rel-A system
MALSSDRMMQSKEIRWSADTGLRQHWRCWDDESIIFQPQSGETHCLNALAASVLQKLCEHPMTASELTTLLQSESGDAPSAREIHTLLRQFDELGLISPLA